MDGSLMNAGQGDESNTFGKKRRVLSAGSTSDAIRVEGLGVHGDFSGRRRTSTSCSAQSWR